MGKDGGDENKFRTSAVGPDGQQYAILSYGGAEGRGPAFVLLPEHAPGWLRSIFGVANRGLRAVQPPAYPTRHYVALGVFEVLNSEGDLDQIHEVRVRDRADLEKTAADLVREIESGTFRPNEL